MSLAETNEQMTVEEVTKRNLRDHVREKWARMIALVSIIVIALGGFNDSWDAIEKLSNFTLSQFTDIPSKNKLDRIYIRASEDVLEETLGAPVYVKKTASGEFIRYYDDKRFVLSAVTQDGAISALLVFPKEGFLPNTEEHAGGELLLEQNLSNIENIEDVRVNYSRSVSYYIEESPAGSFGNLYTSVAGFTEFLTPLDDEKRSRMSELSEGLMLGDDISTQIMLSAILLCLTSMATACKAWVFWRMRF